MNIKQILQIHGAHTPELEQQLIIAIQGDSYRPAMKDGIPPSPLEDDESQWIDTDQVPGELMCGYFVAL